MKLYIFRLKNQQISNRVTGTNTNPVQFDGLASSNVVNLPM